MSLSSLPLLGPVPEALLTEFEGAFVAQQRELCRQWRLAARLWSAAAERDRAFVADELALLMNVHPQSASSLMEVSVRAADLPALLAAWEALELTDRHVRAAVEELHRCLDDATVRVAVLDRVLTRCRERAAEHGWPRPGELRRMIRAAALLIDPAAAQRRERSKTDDRRQLLDAPALRRDLSTPAYRPTRRATRFVRTRDRTCQFPGSTRPARWTDLDHRIAWPHGPTSPANLHCLCRHHHQAKQSSLFTVTTDQHGHTLWTTRTGRTYRRGPTALTPGR